MSYEILKKHKSFGGETIFCEHDSLATKTKMKFSAFLPRETQEVKTAIIWLSGLTCNEENFITKAGAQKFLSQTSTMIICPDTSPRGLGLVGEDDSYDFGSGAGFYVNAQKDPYSENYNMYDYVTKDLVGLLKDDFNIEKMSIMGHSMGGHGALIIGLRENNLFEAISAFSPIVNPMNCPWGQKAFTGYLGDNQEDWKLYDACELLKSTQHKNKILVDQGKADEFLENELLSENLIKACEESGQELSLNYREGYDHSYYFISSFIDEHLAYHVSKLV